MSQDWQNEGSLDNWDDQVFRLSASSIKTHDGCPKRFELSYIKDLPGTKISKGYGVLGSAVHEAIEEVLKDNPAPPRYHNQIREAMVSEFQRINPDVEDDLWERGMNCIDTAAKYVTSPDFVGNMEFEDLEAEFRFSLSRPDVQAGFKGYIDATGDGRIIDWKTGKVREEGELIQGAVYMRGYQELYGEPPEEIIFVYLKEGKERRIEPDDEAWSDMISGARNVIEDIRRGEFEAKPEASKCYWCDHEMWCDASPAGAGGIDYLTFRQRGVDF